MAWWDEMGIKCKAKTKKGKPCKNNVESWEFLHPGGGKELKWYRYCGVHEESRPATADRRAAGESDG